jgi:hypothetical protein
MRICRAGCAHQIPLLAKSGAPWRAQFVLGCCHLLIATYSFVGGRAGFGQDELQLIE